MKPLFSPARVFIGSARESVQVARAIQSHLAHEHQPDVWTDGVFALSQPTLAALIDATSVYDFAIFVLTPDDVTYIRDRQLRTARGNVIFELGLFLGALGTRRTFFVVPRGRAATELPSDLLGVTPATYDHDHFQSNQLGSLGDACGAIQRAMQQEGISVSHHVFARAGREVRTVATGESLNGSPVGLRGLFEYAQNEVFLAAQNHYYVLVKNPSIFKTLLFDFLRTKPNRRIRFLLCHPRHAGVDAWGTLFGTSFNDSSSYRGDLDKAIGELTLWLQEAADQGLSLRARCVPLVPLNPGRHLN